MRYNMGAIINGGQIPQKVYKGKFWIVKEIYIYIFGMNLLLSVGGFFVFSAVANNKEPSNATILFFLAVFYLIAVIARILAIKWGVESVLQQSIVYSQEIWKIILLIMITPLLALFLLSDIIPRGDFLISSSHEASFVDFYGKHIIILGLISVFINGIATYFWFKILTNNYKHCFLNKKNIE